MIKRILIANRGEIAVRILRACREMEIESVALFSPVDSEGLWVRLADDASPIDSYLNVESILKVAKEKKCDAIHPGYGFLSERFKFAKRCREEKVIFIGPPFEVLRKAGDKIEAKRIAAKQKIPVLPSTSSLSTLEEAKDHALDYPFLIKAAAGGGGRGMRIIRSKEELNRNFDGASREAQSSFGDGRLYFEKYLEEPRHIEIQILADEDGNSLYFPERECSIQRRYQKLIEESPSPAVNGALRQKIGKAALSFIQEVGYTNAGTVEFLLDNEGKFYFLEMNARLQVEHPVTERITGIDLVKAQIEIASGKKLELNQSEIEPIGWAFEARINAEDPYQDFLPSPDKVQELLLPGGPGVRIDSALYQGYVIPSAFDSLIAKIIVHEKDRPEAVKRMLRALHETEIAGVATTLPFHKNIFAHPDFQNGKFSTHFIEQRLSELLPPFSEEEMALAMKIAKIEGQKSSIMSVPQNRWSLTGRLENLQTLHEN